MKSQIILFILTGLLFVNYSNAEQVVVGRKAAAKYFEKSATANRGPAAAIEIKDGDSDEAPSIPASASKSLIMLSVGTYTDSQVWNWKGTAKRDSVGSSNYGITYLFDRWKSIDVNLRADFSEYKLDEDRPKKLSLMPLWTLPAADKKFPLYFGFGVGLGVFFKQVEQESSVSLDYNLVMGARFQDVIENVGFFVEYGLKNHLHLFSDGQFNGTSLSGGVTFNF